MNVEGPVGYRNTGFTETEGCSHRRPTHGISAVMPMGATIHSSAGAGGFCASVRHMNSRDCLATASSPRAPLILRKLCPESSSRALDRREVKRACASEPRLLSANNGRHLQTLLTGDAAAATNPVLGAPRRRLMTLDDSSGSVMWTSHRAPMASSRSLDAVSRLPRLVFRWIAWVQLRAAARTHAE